MYAALISVLAFGITPAESEPEILACGSDPSSLCFAASPLVTNRPLKRARWSASLFRHL